MEINGEGGNQNRMKKTFNLLVIRALKTLKFTMGKHKYFSL